MGKINRMRSAKRQWTLNKAYWNDALVLDEDSVGTMAEAEHRGDDWGSLHGTMDRSIKRSHLERSHGAF